MNKLTSWSEKKTLDMQEVLKKKEKVLHRWNYDPQERMVTLDEKP